MKTTSTQIEKSTGVSNRTLLRYKQSKTDLYELLKLGTIALQLQFKVDDFLAIRKIEKIFNKDFTTNQEKVFEDGFRLFTKKGKTALQIEAIKIGMFAQSMNLDLESLQAYKKVILHLREQLKKSYVSL